MENEQRGAAPGASVELAYLPTSDELAEALRARAGAAVPQRRALATGALTLAVLSALVLLAAPELAMAVALAGLCAVLGAFAGGWVHRRYQVRRMTRYARAQGEYTMRADADGVHAATAVAESRIAWSSFRYRIETAHLFVLVVDDTVGGMVLLPKRGLRAGADVEGMRALVARHVPPRPSDA
ncbi:MULTISPECIES: YcxB family protein [Streptomyces]|uniref:YcxB family protein n=1 Tax=Streptomyces TaxID=1883 RepID=UPI002248DDBE|nr:YcxB family protein [Streptomyces sp. JHD 1]MCX2969267.1 YcxB family protein [Streptomyces sp. JHD 1]